MPVHRTASKARARALQLLYAWETTGRPVADVVPGIGRLTGPAPRVLDGAETLATRVVESRERLDQICAEAIEHWRVERLGLIERNVLRIGIYELLTQTAPPKVVIDEALYLAHRFGGRESPALINGVLDRAARLLHRL